MGTAAVFAIGYLNDNGDERFYSDPILGMTSDGFPDNLERVAENFKLIQRQMRILNKDLVGDAMNVARVFQILTQRIPGVFIDELKNTSRVSHSVIFYPQKSYIVHYSGQLEQPVCKRILRNGNWKERWRDEYMYGECGLRAYLGVA